MKIHLEALKNIILPFLKKHDIMLCYLNIETAVTHNCHSNFKVFTVGNREFDHLTVEKVRNLTSYLHEQLRSYLEKNNIKQTLHIETSGRTWATDTITMYFKDSIEFRY